MTHGLIAKYNAKPFMCIKTGMYYPAAQYMAIEVDVHRWGKLALNGHYFSLATRNFNEPSSVAIPRLFWRPFPISSL